MQFFLPKRVLGLAVLLLGVLALLGGGLATTPAPTPAPMEEIDTFVLVLSGVGIFEILISLLGGRRLAVGDQAPPELFNSVLSIVTAAGEEAAAEAGAVSFVLAEFEFAEVEGTNPLAISYGLEYTIVLVLEVGTTAEVDDLSSTVTAEITEGAEEADLEVTSLETTGEISTTPAPVGEPVTLAPLEPTVAPTDDATPAPVCVPGAPVPTAECNDCQALCAAQGGSCFIDPTCPVTQGGLGCNLFGILNCRGCGGNGNFASITCGECPTEPSTVCSPVPAPTMMPVAAPTMMPVMTPTMMPVVAPTPPTPTPPTPTPPTPTPPTPTPPTPTPPAGDECTTYCNTFWPNDLSCYSDPTCATGGIGCGAHQAARTSSGNIPNAMCRFCGSNPYRPCPSAPTPTPPTPTPPTPTPPTPTPPTPTPPTPTPPTPTPPTPTPPAGDECSSYCATYWPKDMGCYTDAACATGGIGCRAHESVRKSSGIIPDAMCRFCGSDPYRPCPSAPTPTPPTPTPPTPPAPTPVPVAPVDECSVLCATVHPDSGSCFTDPTCPGGAPNGGLGCNAHGETNCRFCGRGDLVDCP